MRRPLRIRALAPAVAACAGMLALAACGGSSSGAGASSAASARTSPATGAATATATAPATATGADTATGATTAARSTGGEAPSVVSATSGGVTASMRPSSSRPLAGRPWPISFSVERAGRPVRASVSYEFLFGGQVVAHRSHYTFTGRFSDVFTWPAEAVGYPLTLRAVVGVGSLSIDLDYPVQVLR